MLCEASMESFQRVQTSRACGKDSRGRCDSMMASSSFVQRHLCAAGSATSDAVILARSSRFFFSSCNVDILIAVVFPDGEIG